jgi:Uma2 family endonuclease
MTVTPLSTKKYSSADYLALEVESPTRSEYRDGEIIEMTGGTPAHNEITGDLFVLLKAALKGQPYSVFVTDQRLWIPGANTHCYPDIMVVPRPLVLLDGRKDTVTNPLFVAEVLSDSTKAYDQGDKFVAYRSIETFREYLLVDQHRIYAEQYVKQSANQWLMIEHDGSDARIALSLLDIEIALADLYAGVEL